MMRVPKPKLTELVSGLRADLDAYKQAQLTGGDSLHGYLTDSGNQYDASVALASNTSKKYLLTFTNANTTHGALMTPYINYAIDQTDVNTYYVPPWANGPAIAMLIQNGPVTGTTTTWYLLFTNNDTVSHTAYVKWTFTGTDTGTVSFVQQ
jgi:hypothetical protein